VRQVVGISTFAETYELARISPADAILDGSFLRNAARSAESSKARTSPHGRREGNLERLVQDLRGISYLVGTTGTRGLEGRDRVPELVEKVTIVQNHWTTRYRVIKYHLLKRQTIPQVTIYFGTQRTKKASYSTSRADTRRDRHQHRSYSAYVTISERMKSFSPRSFSSSPKTPTCRAQDHRGE
jgi:hypothetical protein